MPEKYTVTDLFDLAIASERKAQSLYSGLKEMFSHVPEASRFWEEMMDDEEQHARHLEEIFAALTDDETRCTVENSVIERARTGLDMVDVDKNMAAAKTLEDAYQAAYEIEKSEVNSTVGFIAGEFVPSEERKNFIMDLLKIHMAKLDTFSQRVGDTDFRRTVKAIKI